MILTRGYPVRLLNDPAAVDFIMAGLGLLLFVVLCAHREKKRQQDSLQTGK